MIGTENGQTLCDMNRWSSMSWLVGDIGGHDNLLWGLFPCVEDD